MEYKNAEKVLPAQLLAEVRKYVPEGYLYVPGEGIRKAWGSNSRQKAELEQRNRKIRQEFEDGKTVLQISQEYYLTQSSVYRIIRA